MSTRTIKVLVVDDDEAICHLVETALERENVEVTIAMRGDQVFSGLPLQRFDVMVLDQRLPDQTGLEVLERMRAAGRAPEVIMVTGYPTVQTAVEAMKGGAFDYIGKPFSVRDLVRAVHKAADRKRLTRENATLRSMVAQTPFVGPIVSDSPQIKHILDRIERVAPAAAPVLITGETGTGKGLMAKTIHRMSDRSDEPFMQLNCSAFQDQLFESELFGHRKGAFTGAASNKPGLFEVADGGTLFLDEIAELSPAMQAKLLLVLDSGELRQVGGTSVRKVDVRIVAATNEELTQRVESGEFRRDLYFRLNVVHLHVPPLRERREDIDGLIEHYLNRFQRDGLSRKQFSLTARDLLRAYDWPGNVRELANLVETMLLLTPGATIEAGDLPSHIKPGQDADLAIEESTPEQPSSLSAMERVHIMRTLRFTGGLKARAAKILEIDIKTLNRKIRAYDIDVPGLIAAGEAAGRPAGALR